MLLKAALCSRATTCHRAHKSFQARALPPAVASPAVASPPLMPPLMPPAPAMYVGVAFRRGDFRSAYEDLIMASTMGPWVHCELVVVHRGGYAMYGAYAGGSGFARSSSELQSDKWALYVTPVRQQEAIHAIILQTLAANLQYNTRNLWQCVIKAGLPFERDLECDQPDSWSTGTFCSQVALLLLRRMARQGAIDVTPDLRACLEGLHSMGCSPNTLQAVLDRHLARAM